MTHFTVILRHADGIIAIETRASNAAQAANTVLDFEGAPVSAILSIEERN